MMTEAGDDKRRNQRRTGWRGVFGMSTRAGPSKTGERETLCFCVSSAGP